MNEFCLLVEGAGIHDEFKLGNSRESLKKVAEEWLKKPNVFRVHICEWRIYDKYSVVYKTVEMFDKRSADKEWNAPNSWNPGEVFSIWFNDDGTTTIDFSGEMIDWRKLLW